MYQQGVTPLLQVHDELAFSVSSAEQALGYAEVMKNAIKLSVPSQCDIDLGESWGEAKPLENT